jgi:hypothetical protein
VRVHSHKLPSNNIITARNQHATPRAVFLFKNSIHRLHLVDLQTRNIFKMRFFAKIAAVAAAASAVVSAANTVTFVSQDSTARKIIFTPSAGNSEINSIELAGLDTQTVTFPESWIGNWYSVSEGADNTNGMLGEVTFQGWNGITYFDVSAIVNANDHDGVHQMWPASQNSASPKSLMSGCAVFPCNTAYYLPDDVQTVTTTETALYCTLGSQSSSSTKRDATLVSRNFVLGKL